MGDVGVALDANRPDFTADGPPRFFWWAEDLLALLQFRDPDGNLLMACART